MNSMNSINTIIDSLKDRFKISHHESLVKNQLAVDIDQDDFFNLLPYLKHEGWKQLTLITCIDWIDRNEFQLAYTFMNWENGITLIVRTLINREQPVFKTITSIYPGAQYYERDVHEFFGVSFEGNPESEKPLFLEIWDDMPPMKKDFDPLAYSQRKYPDREYKIDFKTEAGDNNG